MAFCPLSVEMISFTMPPLERKFDDRVTRPFPGHRDRGDIARGNPQGYACRRATHETFWRDSCSWIARAPTASHCSRPPDRAGGSRDVRARSAPEPLRKHPREPRRKEAPWLE